MSGHESPRHEQRAIAGPAPGSVAREEFGSRELAVQSEIASAGLAAQARTEIEALYIWAERHPRNLDVARQKLLKECARPSFAKVARYVLKFGGKPIPPGPSIRFAEAARRAYRNLHASARTVYDDPMKRIVRVSVFDVEDGLSDTKDVTVTKTVERRQLRENEIPLSIRHNAEGQQLYIIQASDLDLRAKEGGEVARAKRNLILGLLPGDLVEEAMAAVAQTLSDEFAKDPNAGRKQLVDAFGALGVYAQDLEKYLGHDLDHLSPEEGGSLWGLHDAIRSGDVRWKDVVAEAETPKPPAEKTPEKRKRGVAGAKAALREQAAAPPAPAPAEPEPAFVNDNPIQPMTLATLLARAGALGIAGDMALVRAIDNVLGGVGITALDDITEPEAADVIAKFEREIAARAKGAKP